MIDEIPINNQTKLIPIEELTSEVVLYWRCLAEHLNQEAQIEAFEEIVSELSPFCAYIKEYITMMGSKKCNQWEIVLHKFILHQLFEMVKVYDLSDELGRKNLKELILETLISEHTSEKITECTVLYLEKVMPNVNERIAAIVEVINELMMPTKTSEVAPVIVSDAEREEKSLNVS